MASDPGMNEEHVLLDQIKPVQFGCKLSAAQEHAVWRCILELLYSGAQVARNVVAVSPGEVIPLRRHHVLPLGLQLDRPLAHCRRRFRLAAGDRWLVAFHHLVGDAPPQHCPALVHETGEEGVRLVVGDAFLVVGAAVQCEVDAEGQDSHGVLCCRYTTSRLQSVRKGTSAIRMVPTLSCPTCHSS